MYACHLHVWMLECERIHVHNSCPLPTLLLLSAATYSTLSQTGRLTSLKRWDVQSFQALLFFFCETSGCLSAFGFLLALLPLGITCVALSVALPAMLLYEKWISPSLLCHGDAEFTRQVLKDLHQSGCSDVEVRRRLGRVRFHPSLTQHLRISHSSYFRIV